MYTYTNEEFFYKIKKHRNICVLCKEIIKRRHGEPIKFLFPPEMGLLDSQASNEKKYWL